MTQKLLGMGWIFSICVSLSGCVWAQSLSNHWSENFALATHGAIANHPSLNDGKLDTIAVIDEKKDHRIFTVKFSEIKKVRRIIIHNGNLFRFHLDHFDVETGEWKTFHKQSPQGDFRNKRPLPKFVIDRLNVETSTILIYVARTVDDKVIEKPITGVGEKVRQQVYRYNRIDKTYVPIDPAPAKIREVEVYQLASRNE